MSHLDLQDNKSYRQWVFKKENAYDKRAADDFPLVIDINANGEISSSSLSVFKAHIENYNFALYRLNGEVTDHLASVKQIGAQMGLKELDKNLCAREDRVTKLMVTEQGRGNIYIPYSNKAIGWHTDGYYNPLHQRVLAMVLHCEQPSEQGGVNDLLDHDMAYIHLRNENPDFIRALSKPEVMCIPANLENGIEIRPQTCSAVFMQESESAQDPVLAMRFSQRKRHIIWSDDALTRDALACLFEFLESDSPYHVTYRLNSGEGVICNNILHTRSAFTDSLQKTRVYYRARYYNRIKI